MCGVVVPGLIDDLAALDVLALDAADEQTDVLAGLTLVEQLAEHLDAGDGGLGALRLDTDDLDVLVDLDDAALDPAGDDGATTGDREDVLDRHEERLLDVALGSRDRSSTAFISSTIFSPHSASPSRALSADTLTIGMSSPGYSYSREQLAHLELDELEDLLVVDHVGLVEGDNDRGHADLAGQEHVLLGLRHRTVGGGDDEDRAVHLRRAGDHVLDVVGVTGAVDVRVVTRLGLVLVTVGAIELVIPRSRSSGALSIMSNAEASLRSGYLSCSTLVIAAVRVVLPWSMWPMVPMLTCGLVRSNLAFATGVLLWTDFSYAVRRRS